MNKITGVRHIFNSIKPLKHKRNNTHSTIVRCFDLNCCTWPRTVEIGEKYWYVMIQEDDKFELKTIVEYEIEDIEKDYYVKDVETWPDGSKVVHLYKIIKNSYHDIVSKIEEYS